MEIMKGAICHSTTLCIPTCYHPAATYILCTITIPQVLLLPLFISQMSRPVAAKNASKFVRLTTHSWQKTTSENACNIRYLWSYIDRRILNTTHWHNSLGKCTLICKLSILYDLKWIALPKKLNGFDADKIFLDIGE